MKTIWYLTIGLLVLLGIDIIISSEIGYRGAMTIEVPRLVSLLVGSFIIYGAYIIWDELLR